MGCMMSHSSLSFLSQLQVQREAVSREYANMRYEQPYQTAIYTSSLLHELRKWHVSEYQAVIDDLTPDHVTVKFSYIHSFKVF